MILIADDDSDFAENCSMVLESHGYHVEIALNTSKALAKIAEHRPELLISDCYMPDIGGVKLSEQLRKRQPDEQFPIILMSSSLRSQVAPSEGSYNAFLRKPFLAEDLLREVRKLLPNGPNANH